MKESKEELRLSRRLLGLYTIKELSDMFDIGRHKIDLMINTGKLKYVSPNGKTRYVLLKDYVNALGIDFEAIKKDSNLNGLLSGRVDRTLQNAQLNETE